MRPARPRLKPSAARARPSTRTPAVLAAGARALPAPGGRGLLRETNPTDRGSADGLRSADLCVPHQGRAQARTLQRQRVWTCSLRLSCLQPGALESTATPREPPDQPLQLHRTGPWACSRGAQSPRSSLTKTGSTELSAAHRHGGLHRLLPTGSRCPASEHHVQGQQGRSPGTLASGRTRPPRCLRNRVPSLLWSFPRGSFPPWELEWHQVTPSQRAVLPVPTAGQLPSEEGPSDLLCHGLHPVPAHQTLGTAWRRRMTVSYPGARCVQLPSAGTGFSGC